MSFKKDECQICGCKDTKVLSKESFEKDVYEYSICKQCSFVFQTNRYAKEKYFSLPCKTQKNYVEHSKNRARYIYDFCTSYLSDKNIKVLDVGCYRGGVMKYIAKLIKNADVFGCTIPSKQKPLKNTNIIYDSFEFMKFKEKCDFIIMSHVVEHFLDLRNSLRKLKTIMNDNALTYIEVPSLDYLKVRLSFEFCPEHLSYFTVHSLSNLLLSEGFKILKIKESKYWGNIKVLIQKNNKEIIYFHKNKYYIFYMIGKNCRRFTHWFYRFMLKNFNIGANS